MIKHKIQIDANTILLVYANGKVVTIRTDDGSAAQLANFMLDWSDYFKKLDEEHEVMRILEVA